MMVVRLDKWKSFNLKPRSHTMDKVHKITGLGPVQADGSVDIFTIRNTPFHVEKAWLDQYAAMPTVGEDLVEREDGTLELGVEDAPAEAAAPAVDDTQKKTDGGDASGSQSEPSLIVTSGAQAPAPEVIPPTPPAIVWKEYVAQPFVVRAAVVESITPGTDVGSGTAQLDNGASVQFAAATVNVGDFWLSHDTAPNANGGFLSANDFNQMFEIDPEQQAA